MPKRTANPGDNGTFFIGRRVFGAAHVKPYERKGDDPVYRPLRIFTLDPAQSRLEGSIALVNIPYEPLAPGPEGRIFKVDNYDGRQNLHYRKVNLDDPHVLIRDGRDPSPSDPMFHQQMAYAVCTLVYSAFKKALGRDIAWGFEGVDDPARTQLLIRPHACDAQNAFYDKMRGELSFGYYRSGKNVAGLNLPDSYVFTCLSHDIVAHEVTHALLDGLRAHFTYPGGPDVLAFHEAFADLVAVFQHFSYDKVLREAIRKSRGDLEKAELLTDIARQFGHTTGGSYRALRTVIDIDPTNPRSTPPQYQDVETEPHKLGSVLTSAVFDAFLTVFKRKVQRYVRLATNGSGVIPDGELSADLQNVLAEEASKLARQFLNMCIRAIDYCPPVDLEFGEFLRAVITADYDLIPDDPWGYRMAWIDAFRKRGIYPRNVSSLSEDALLWRPPTKPMEELSELSFAELRFEGDPGHPAGREELKRQADALGRQIVTNKALLEELGLTRVDVRRPGRETIAPVCVESIRSSRRIGPDGQVVFDLIAEVTQRKIVQHPDNSLPMDYYGGATLILGPRGELRYVISKSVENRERLESLYEFMRNDVGRRFWTTNGGRHTPKKQIFKLLHKEQA